MNDMNTYRRYRIDVEDNDMYIDDDSDTSCNNIYEGKKSSTQSNHNNNGGGGMIDSCMDKYEVKTIDNRKRQDFDPAYVQDHSNISMRLQKYLSNHKRPSHDYLIEGTPILRHLHNKMLVVGHQSKPNLEDTRPNDQRGCFKQSYTSSMLSNSSNNKKEAVFGGVNRRSEFLSSRCEETPSKYFCMHYNDDCVDIDAQNLGGPLSSRFRNAKKPKRNSRFAGSSIETMEVSDAKSIKRSAVHSFAVSDVHSMSIVRVEAGGAWYLRKGFVSVFNSFNHILYRGMVSCGKMHDEDRCVLYNTKHKHGDEDHVCEYIEKINSCLTQLYFKKKIKQFVCTWVMYQGSILHNKIEGRGKIFYSNGATMEGMFRGGKMEGRCRFEDGKLVVDGLWSENILQITFNQH